MAEPRVTVAEAVNPADAIGVRETQHDRPHDVVEAGAEAPAREDAAGERGRFEEDAWPRSRRLEGRQTRSHALELGRVAANEHSPLLVDERLVCARRHERRRVAAL